jgi:hypothetical protein
MKRAIMSTVKDIIDRLSKLDPDSVVAIPTIWEKDTAEEVYEYATGDVIELSIAQWNEVVEDFENAEIADDEAMVESIRLVLND